MSEKPTIEELENDVAYLTGMVGLLFAELVARNVLTIDDARRIEGVARADMKASHTVI